MKTIGLIGGLSWESTAVYYRLLNEAVRERLGGLHSVPIVLWSFDFAEIEALQSSARWDEATQRMIDAALHLQQAGADLLVIASNTMHRMADEVQDAVDIPLLHIADATANAIVRQRIQNVGLLGTRYTMEQDFYRGRLEQHGLGVITPEDEARAIINHIIYDELVLGIIRQDSKQVYLDIIQDLISKGAQGIILGCTEIMLLVGQEDIPVRAFDTTSLHVLSAVDAALTP